MGHWDPILQNIVLECQWPLQHAYGAEKSVGKIYCSNNRAMNIVNLIIPPIITTTKTNHYLDEMSRPVIYPAFHE